MPFPSTNGTNAVTLQSALYSAMSLAAAVKTQCQNWVTVASAGTLDGSVITQMPAWLNRQNATFTSLAATSGLAAYAQSQLGNATFDIAAAFTAMQSAITATVSWITTNFPKEADGFLSYAKFDGSGNITYTVFTAAQLSGLITQLNSLIATIN